MKSQSSLDNIAKYANKISKKENLITKNTRELFYKTPKKKTNNSVFVTTVNHKKTVIRTLQNWRNPCNDSFKHSVVGMKLVKN
jgi:uncharacterized protein (DUF1697 family)